MIINVALYFLFTTDFVNFFFFFLLLKSSSSSSSSPSSSDLIVNITRCPITLTPQAYKCLFYKTALTAERIYTNVYITCNFFFFFFCSRPFNFPPSLLFIGVIITTGYGKPKYSGRRATDTRKLRAASRRRNVA